MTAEECIAEIEKAMEGCLDNEGDRHGQWSRAMLVEVLEDIERIVDRFRVLGERKSA